MHKKLLRAALALLIVSVILSGTYFVLRALFPRTHSDIIDKYCAEFNVDTHLAAALIKAESNFDENAVSHANAKGLMQLTEETFDFCNKNLNMENSDIFNPHSNIRAGVWYLSYLLNRYGGNTDNAVAAYNAGATNVDNWLSDSRYSADGKTLKEIPFGETLRHVEKISRYRAIYKFLY